MQNKWVYLFNEVDQAEKYVGGEWEKVRALGHPPLEDEPLLTNNSVFYRLSGEFPDAWLDDLRHHIRVTCESGSHRPCARSESG